CHGAGFHAAVRDRTYRCDAQRNLAPPRARAAHAQGARSVTVPDLGPHAAFILAAYAAAVFIVVGLCAWVIVDYRVQRRVLAELDEQGIRRRSDAVGREEPA